MIIEISLNTGHSDQDNNKHPGIATYECGSRCWPLSTSYNKVNDCGGWMAVEVVCSHNRMPHQSFFFYLVFFFSYLVHPPRTTISPLWCVCVETFVYVPLIRPIIQLMMVFPVTPAHLVFSGVFFSSNSNCGHFGTHILPKAKSKKCHTHKRHAGVFRLACVPNFSLLMRKQQTTFGKKRNTIRRTNMATMTQT